jgi:hypothetical protein
VVIASAIWSPTRRTGFSACIAPWNTIDAPVHRTARRRRPCISSTFSPSSKISPSVRADFGSSLRSAAAIVDFPHPDSPASPSTSPRSICRSTPRTAGTSPPLVRYVTDRSRANRTLIARAASD